MNSENAGERVFANVDEALAEKIISRSKQNSENAKSKVDNTVSPVLNGAAAGDNVLRYSRKSILMIVVAAMVGALLIFAALIFRRKDKN